MKKTTILISTIILIISGGLLLSLFFTGFWSEDWLSRLYDMSTDMAEGERLRKHLERAHLESYQALNEEYPLGYALLAVDIQGHMVYQDDHMHAAFGVDWDQARLVQITDGAVSLVPPAIFFQDISCDLSGTIVSFSRTRWNSSVFCDLQGRRVVLKILKDTGDAVIFILTIINP